MSVFVLYIGQDLLVPLALAILLSFVLAPLVVGSRRLGLPRVPAVIVVALVAAAGFTSLMTAAHWRWPVTPSRALDRCALK